MRSRWRALVGGLGTTALAAGVLGLTPSASAQVVEPFPATATIVHAIQGVDVDVYLGGALVSDADGFEPGESIGPVYLEPGALVVEVFAHTVTPAPEAPPAGAPLIAEGLTVPDGPIDVSVAAGFTELGIPTLFPFVNDVSAVPPTAGRLSVRHTAVAGPVDVYADGSLVIADLATGESEDLVLPADTYAVEVFAAGDDPAGTPLIGPLDVTVGEGELVQVYASTTIARPLFPTLVQVVRDIPSQVTALHAIPGAPNVDISVGDLDKTLLVDDLAYGETAGPLALAGPEVITVTDPDGAVLAATIVDLSSNADVTMVVHLDAFGNVVVSPFTNDLAPPPAGQARISARHVAFAGTADVCVDGEPLITALSNGASDDIEVVAGEYELSLIGTGGSCTSPVVGPVTATFEPGVLYQVYAVGDTGPPSTLSLLIVSEPTDALFNPVAPLRIIDTRDGTGDIDAVPLAPGEVLVVSPGGSAGIPTAGVEAVALNVTAAEPAADGYLAVFPCDEEPPDPETSNVNYTAGEIAEPNAVIAGLDSVTGDFCITTSAPTDVIVDVFAWFASDSGLATSTPERIVDTRDPAIGPVGQLLPGEVLRFEASDDPDVTGVVLNVTAANTTAPGYLAVFPCDEGDDEVPGTSNVNYGAGEAGAPNAVLTGVGGTGDVCVSTYAPVDVVVDLLGTFSEGSPFLGFTPERLVDTRDGTGDVPVGKLQPGAVLEVPIAADDPFGIDGVTLNVTATEADGNGYLTVFACDQPQPYVSNVNYTTEELSSPNAVVTGIGADGSVCITAYAPVHVVVDVTGAFFSGALPAGSAPAGPRDVLA